MSEPIWGILKGHQGLFSLCHAAGVLGGVKLFAKGLKLPHLFFHAETQSSKYAQFSQVLFMYIFSIDAISDNFRKCVLVRAMGRLGANCKNLSPPIRDTIRTNYPSLSGFNFFHEAFSYLIGT